MKYNLVIACIVLSISKLLAQQIPTGTSLPPFAPTTPTSTIPWLRGGNINAGSGATDNIFGTAFNSPIYTITDNTIRTRLNGTFTATGTTAQPAINGVGFPTINTSGYFGIGPNGYFATQSPWAMLHLEGPNSTSFSGNGWRQWMKTGVFIKEESDAMYVGLKQNASNQSDAIVSWSDDLGTDKLRFVFTGNAPGAGSSTNPISSAGLDGYEFMRMQASPSQFNSLGEPVGNVGIGPVFTTALPPQNRLHVNAEEEESVFMQVSNAGGTGQAGTDGMLIGYASTNTNNREALISQQENDRLTFYSNSGERMRIMQIGALNGGININPGGLPNNTTRVAISHNPALPVTRPLSLLHLGYDAGIVSATPGATDGWRSWMDIGMFVSNGTDNTFIGLKEEPAFLGDRQDAVINWGDNQSTGTPFPNGPDNLRFIFTATTTGSGTTAPANLQDGLEGGRMTPTLNTGIFTGFGGDPTATIGNPYGPAGADQNPTATLEVNSWGATTDPGGNSGLRFTNLQAGNSPTIPNPGTGVLSVNATGDVIYVPGSTGNAVGNYCTTPANPLTGSDYEVPLNNLNYRFTGQGLLPTNQVGIGYNCTVPMPAKLSVLQNTGFPVPLGANSITGAFSNKDVTAALTATFTALVGVTNGVQPSGNINNIGVAGRAANAPLNYGVKGLAGSPGVGSQNYAGSFAAIELGASDNYGVLAEARNGATNFGVYATTPVTGTDRAGYFAGDIQTTSAMLITSDQMFKTNVESITNARDILQQLHPRNYTMDVANYPNFNFESRKQYGFIAQEVEPVLPELVHASHHPAEVDTAGNIIRPAVDYKAINYNAFIPLTVAAINELGQQLQQKDSAIGSLQEQVNHVMAMLNECCNRSSGTGSTSEQPLQRVDLTDGQSIVLEQNVPNPFAEQTTINYFLPDNVSKAQMLFYNAQGKLIQSAELTQKGKGQLNVFANDLSSGIYTYTLIVDGRIVETKKMVKQ